VRRWRGCEKVGKGRWNCCEKVVKGRWRREGREGKGRWRSFFEEKVEKKIHEKKNLLK
jgi:hypothetical protein